MIYFLKQNVVSANDLYAENTTLYDAQTDIWICKKNPKTAFNVFKSWCQENGMLLNPDKTKMP